MSYNELFEKVTSDEKIFNEVLKELENDELIFYDKTTDFIEKLK